MSRGGRRAPLTVVVLAQGLGTRTRPGRAHPLHPAAGRPMVAHVLESARALGPTRTIAVLGREADEVRAELAGLCDDFVLRAEPAGPGRALLEAAQVVGKARGATVLIVSGDVPAVRAATLRSLVEAHRRSGAALSLVSADVDDPRGRARVVRAPSGRLARIVDDRGASPAERRIREIDCGIYCAHWAKLLGALRSRGPSTGTRDDSLADAVRRLLARGEKVAAVRAKDAEEVRGVRSRADLARAGLALYRRKVEELQASGVIVVDPSTTWVDSRARVGRDTVLYPGVLIEGPSVIGRECVVRSGCRLVNTVLGRGVEIRDLSVIEHSRLRDGASAGPFAHFRPGVVLDPGAKVGNFVELKKSRLGRGTKAMHLTYLGDARIGPGCNIGAGTITCNYDGARKSPTTIGRGVFVGSDTQLVAPVRVGPGAYVAAGTTVTKDVPGGALAISRSPQTNVAGWAARKKSGNAGKRSARTGRR